VALNEAAILQRGLDTFAELGYAATTMRELAKRLDVNHNFINDRYGSKADFWQAVVDFAMRDLVAYELAAFDSELDDAEQLVNVVRRFYRIAARNPGVNRMIADESVRESSRLDYLHEHFTSKFWDQVKPLALRLMDAGRMPRVPVELVFFAISGPAVTLTQDPLARRLGRPATGADHDLNRLADHLARLVLAGLLPGSDHLVDNP
jgi:TetR/AcrR family transcriptional regulator